MSNVRSNVEPSLIVPLTLIVVPVFFSDTLFDTAALQYVSISLGFALLLCIAFRQNWHLYLSVPIVLWVMFVALAVINRNHVFETGLGRSWFILFPIALLSASILSNAPGDKWKANLQTIIIACATVHAFVTVLSFIFPWFYSAIIRDVIFGSVETITGEGYQAGLTTHYSTNGLYLAIGFIIAGTRWLNIQSWNNLVITLFFFFALVLTAKRAHFAFSVIAITMLCLIMYRGREFQSRFKIAAVLLVVVLLFWILSFVSEDIGLLLDRFSLVKDDDTMNGRTDFYELCYELFAENPLLGNGWGSYTLNFNLTSLGVWYSSLGYTGMFAHNVFLQVLAEEGVVGGVLFVGATAASLCSSIRVLLQCDAGSTQAVYPATSLAIQTFFILYCITGNPLYDMQAYVPYMLLIAFSLSKKQMIKRDSFVKQKCDH